MGPEEDDGLPPDVEPDPDLAPRYFNGHANLTEIRSTREYPVNVASVVELLFILVLPLVSNFLTQYLLELV